MRIVREAGYGTVLEAVRQPRARQEWADARSAALLVQRLRLELPQHSCTRQAAGPEGGSCAALCQRPVEEPHRQAAGCLDPDHPSLAGAVRPSLRPEARAKGPGRADRARREGALSETKSGPLWIWKAWDRATGQLVDWECGGRDKVTCERLLERPTVSVAAEPRARPVVDFPDLRRRRQNLVQIAISYTGRVSISLGPGMGSGQRFTHAMRGSAPLSPE